MLYISQNQVTLLNKSFFMQYHLEMEWTFLPGNTSIIYNNPASDLLIVRRWK